MYRWNTPNKFIQTNLNMRYLDSRYNTPCFLVYIYLLKGKKKGRLIAQIAMQMALRNYRGNFGKGTIFTNG